MPEAHALAAELFDLVDDEDNVIGREKRSVCHAKGLLHRAVYCWVFNGQGQLLVQRRRSVNFGMRAHMCCNLKARSLHQGC